TCLQCCNENIKCPTPTREGECHSECVIRLVELSRSWFLHCHWEDSCGVWVVRHSCAGGWCWSPSVLSPCQVKSQLEEKENQKFPVFKAVSYRSQVVAGTNFFIKVDVGDEKCVHLRVFRSLPHENKPLTLHAYQTDKAKHDELTYF
ncbi:cystatin-B, partial [Marmota marmota marmota]|uniref:Cystatin-B n=1 Tax=Marmota marmota marmota TaxID=9994 RepID=A0A8C5ZAZ2_MARMA